MMQVKNLSSQDCLHAPKLNRYGHTMTLCNNSAYIFGGLLMNLSGEKSKLMYNLQFTNELVLFDLKERKWYNTLLQSGTLPLARHFHSCVAYSDKLYIFGGKSNGYFNDVQEFDTLNDTWTVIKSLSGSVPSKRYGHSAAVFGDCMWIYGGYDDETGVCDDLYQFDLKKFSWNRIVVKPKPSGRFHHQMVILNDSLWIYGGSDGIQVFDDLWSFDLVKSQWNLHRGSGSRPEKKHSASMFVVGDSIVVFGGCNKDHDFEMCHSFDLKKSVWSRDTDFPIEYTSGTVYTTCVQYENSLYFFGGITKKRNVPIEVNLHVERFNSNEVSTIETLSEDVFRVIFSFLDRRDILNLTETSKNGIFANIAKSDWYWKPIMLETVKPTMTEENVVQDSFKDPGKNYYHTLVSFCRDISNLVTGYKVYNLNHRYIGSNVFFGASHIKYEPIDQRTCTVGMAESVKWVYVGDGATGKSCLGIVMSGREYPTGYVPTAFDNELVEMKLNNGSTHHVSLWDTAGPEDYDRLRPLSYPYTGLFLITFSVVSRHSFINVWEKWIKEVRLHCPDTAVILVGTKIDLREDKEIVSKCLSRKMPVVGKVEGIALAKRLGAVAYHETSSLTGQGIRELVQIAVVASTYLSHKHEEVKKNQKCDIQ